MESSQRSAQSMASARRRLSVMQQALADVEQIIERSDHAAADRPDSSERKGHAAEAGALAMAVGTPPIASAVPVTPAFTVSATAGVGVSAIVDAIPDATPVHTAAVGADWCAAAAQHVPYLQAPWIATAVPAAVAVPAYPQAIGYAVAQATAVAAPAMAQATAVEMPAMAQATAVEVPAMAQATASAVSTAVVVRAPMAEGAAVAVAAQSQLVLEDARRTYSGGAAGDGADAAGDGAGGDDSASADALLEHARAVVHCFVHPEHASEEFLQHTARNVDSRKPSESDSGSNTDSERECGERRLRITKVETRRCGAGFRNFCFVKMSTTDPKVVGWSE
jgi:hypothetical protein